VAHPSTFALVLCLEVIRQRGIDDVCEEAGLDVDGLEVERTGAEPLRELHVLDEGHAVLVGPVLDQNHLVRRVQGHLKRLNQATQTKRRL